MLLATAIRELRSILNNRRLGELSDSTAGRENGGKWTRKEILGHLIDSASNNHHRFVRAQFEPGFAMPGYKQSEWVAANQYGDRPWSELVALWSSYNRHLLFLMERVPGNRLANLCKIGDGDPVTLEFLMTDYVDHLKHHLDQILAG